MAQIAQKQMWTMLVNTVQSRYKNVCSLRIAISTLSSSSFSFLRVNSPASPTTFILQWCESCLATSVTCSTSSLDDTMIRHRGRFGWVSVFPCSCSSSLRLLKIGSRYASVLPVPVGAMMSMSSLQLLTIVVVGTLHQLPNGLLLDTAWRMKSTFLKIATYSRREGER